MKHSLLFSFAALFLFALVACEQETPVDCSLSGPGLIIQNVSDARCTPANGATINLATNGGEAPYSFSLFSGSSTDGITNNSGTFDGIAAGEYRVSVTDAQGCEASDMVLIKTGLTYANDIQSIIETNCAVPTCHVPGSQTIDYLNPQNVIGRGVSIQFQLENEQMPPDTSGITLDPADIQRIICWVQDGEPG